MKKLYEQKDISDSVKDVSTTTRKVKVAISQVGSLDLDNDVIDPSAYTKTIVERGPKGSNMIWHLTDHRASLKDAIGKPSEVFMEGDFLVFITEIPKTNWGNDALELYKSGAINQHSIGFRTIKSEPVNAGKNDEYNLIKEVTLYEGSAVLFGANPNTPTLSVGKSLTKEERQTEFQKTIDDLSTFYKLFKTGHLTDETFELIEVKLLQLTNKLQQLFEDTTLPAQKAVEPESKDLLDVLTTFNNNFKLDDNVNQRRIAETTR